MKVPGHPMNLKEPLNPTPLLLPNFPLNPINQVMQCHKIIKNRRLRQHSALLRDTLLEQLARHINNMCAHHILYVQSQYIAWGLVELDIDIDVELIVVVRHIDEHVAPDLDCEVLLEFTKAENGNEDGADGGDEGPAEGGLGQVFWHFPEKVKFLEAEYHFFILLLLYYNSGSLEC